jgi:dolichol-phosphate hexosyltransferase
VGERGLVTIVVPAKNEEAAIGRTLRCLPVTTLAAMGLGCEVVVLDGQSQDGTVAIARRWGARIITDREPGKGNALRHARPQLGGDYIVMLDGDGTYAAEAVAAAVAALDRGADVVMGRRRILPGAMKPVNRVGNRLLSLAARMLYLRRCPDVCTGLWGFRREALLRLPLRSRGFGLEAELFALSARLRLRMAVVEVDYLPRHGPSKLGFARDGFRIARRLLRSRFAPLGEPAGGA